MSQASAEVFFSYSHKILKWYRGEQDLEMETESWSLKIELGRPWCRTIRSIKTFASPGASIICIGSMRNIFLSRSTTTVIKS